MLVHMYVVHLQANVLGMGTSSTGPHLERSIQFVRRQKRMGLRMMTMRSFVWWMERRLRP